MTIKEVKIHNFRGIRDVSFRMSDYTLLIGANNAGKSTVVDAIRCFYEKDSCKFEEGRDLPKGVGNESVDSSWVEICYELAEDEKDSLKEAYRSDDCSLRLRKYFHPKEVEGRKSGFIYFVSAANEVSTDSFYGARNVQCGKLGNVIYIPAFSRVDETTKLTGPSALRDMLAHLFKQFVGSSKAYDEFTSAIEALSHNLNEQKVNGDYALSDLGGEINRSLRDWGAEFNLSLIPPSNTDIIKSMIDWHIYDKTLGCQQDITSYGSGFQRHFIFALIQACAKYRPVEESMKATDFKPKMDLILFEEPEAFLHPQQQSVMARSLRNQAKSGQYQVLVTTHSAQFLSSNMDDISKIVRMQRDKKGHSVSFQVSNEMLNEICSSNRDFTGYPDIDTSDMPREDLEMIRYQIWMDPLRAGMFFAQQVLVVEGATETAFINRLLDDEKLQLPPGAFVVESLGKFNMHRYMKLLDALGIQHSVLHDKDKSTNQKSWNALIHDNRNERTLRVHVLDDDLEVSLGLGKYKGRSDNKPANLLYKYEHNEIAESKVQEFSRMIESLFKAKEN